VRNQFPGYYSPGAETFAENFKVCIFCFDTNVLLNLYRYTSESRDNLIKVLQAVSDRVWLPHQVGFEYQRRRTDVLLEQNGLSEEFEIIVDSAIKQLEQLQRSSRFAVNAMANQIKHDLIKTKKKLQPMKQQKPDLMTGDTLFGFITELFDGKVGKPYSHEEYKAIYKKGKERYENKIPPGYKDKSNNPNDTDQYGDLILWLQIIDYAKTEDRPIILVTDDAKEDWWREVKGEKLGPKPDLMAEFMSETGGNKWFYMYSTEQFLKYSKEYLQVDVQPEVIKEAEVIEKQDVEQEKIRTTIREANDTFAAVEAIAQARTTSLDSIRETFARMNFSSEAMKKALAISPGEEIRRALAQTSISTEEIRRALAFATVPGEDIRRALAQATISPEEIRRALAFTSVPSNEEIRRALQIAMPYDSTFAVPTSTPKSKAVSEHEQSMDVAEKLEEKPGTENDEQK